jgi:hypothetical protein
MNSCGCLEEDADDDPDERFLSQGIRELASPLGVAGWDERGLGKEEEPGLGL